jgi:hypothetical protein
MNIQEAIDPGKAARWPAKPGSVKPPVELYRNAMDPKIAHHTSPDRLLPDAQCLQFCL